MKPLTGLYSNCKLQALYTEPKKGATTFSIATQSITTFSITALSIKGLYVTLSIREKGVYVSLSIGDT